MSMSRFIGEIAKLVCVVGLAAIGLDVAYTTVLSRFSDRSVLRRVRQMHDHRYDYIVVGSSRAMHHVDPALLEREFGKRGINLGEQDAAACDAFRVVRDFLARNTTDAVFVHVDKEWGQDGSSPLVTSLYAPFVREVKDSADGRDLFGSDYLPYRWLPFYRYVKLGPAIGFREVLFSLLGKRRLAANGFAPLHGKRFNADVNMEQPHFPDRMNLKYQQILDLCNDRGVKIHFFTSPCHGMKYDSAILTKYLPGYQDFSAALPEQKYFGDPRHMNGAGAEAFTRLLGEAYFSPRAAAARQSLRISQNWPRPAFREYRSAANAAASRPRAARSASQSLIK